MKRYYLTTLNGEEVYEHCGNIRGARKKARELSKKRNEEIYINDCENEEIVDCIFN